MLVPSLHPGINQCNEEDGGCSAWCPIPSTSSILGRRIWTSFRTLDRAVRRIWYWLAAYVAFQLSMVARIDDTAKFRAPDLQPLHAFPDYGITTQLCWSKTVVKNVMCLLRFSLVLMIGGTVCSAYLHHGLKCTFSSTQKRMSTSLELGVYRSQEN